MSLKFKEVAIGFSRGSAFWPSRIIEWLDGEYSHCYWKFVTVDGIKLIYESHFSGGVQITPYEQLEDAIISGVVEKINEIKLDADADGLWKECIKLHGKPYDKGQIIRYLIWMKWYHMRNKKVLRLYDDGKYTCNEFCITTGRIVVPIMKDLDYSYTPNRLLKVFNVA